VRVVIGGAGHSVRLAFGVRGLCAVTLIVSLAGNAIRVSSTSIARISLANPALWLVGHKIQGCPGGYEGFLSDAVFELSE
jgi:hypothetical protein